MAVRAERLASVDQDVESDADDENPGPSTSKKQKMSAKSVGAAKYRTKFQKEWLKVYPFVQEVKDNPHKFLCNICMRQVACDHQAMNYALKNLPINDPMLINATFVNYDTKDDATFSQVEYFVQRFGELLPFTPARELELLQEEFTDYQLLMHDAIPSDVWNKAVTDEDEHTTYHRMDIVWHHLSSLKAPDGNPRFNRLSKIAKVVLVIPHSNAQEERIFSMVRKNKTCFRPNLDPKGTLSSILTVKLATKQESLGIAGVGVEPTSNGAGSPPACAGWATEAPVRMEAVRGHSPGGNRRRLRKHGLGPAGSTTVQSVLCGQGLMGPSRCQKLPWSKLGQSEVVVQEAQ
ncbi:hypothetical protein EMCRGX_G018251 [Ephydatia muelleri]